MKRFLIAVIVVAMMSGCTKRGAVIGVGVGVGIAATGGVVATNPGGDNQSAMGAAFVGIDLAVLGGLVVVGSLVGMSIGPLHDPKPVTPSASPPASLLGPRDF